MTYPRGAIPHVERQWSHEKFVQAAQPETVLTKINHAARLWKDNTSFAEYFGPNVDVITTTTIEDDKLERLLWRHEFDYVHDLEPKWHIPTDHSDYVSMPAEKRIEKVQKCVRGTLWMADQIEAHGLETNVIPLLKGVTREEREICYRGIDAYDFDMAAFYVTRYFTAKRGNNICQLVDDIETIRKERPDINLLVIGLLSPNYLSRLPDNVVAAAGLNTWRKQVTPRKSSQIEIREQYTDIKRSVEAALPSRSDVADQPAIPGGEQMSSTPSD